MQSARLATRLAGRSILAGLVFLICFSLLELGLRVVRPTQRYWPYHKNSMRLFYPSEKVTPGVNGITRFSANSLGTRGPEPGNELVRLLAVGGSTTACTVLDDSEAWPQLLMDRINESAGNQQTLWVTNSGIDGLNSQHHLMHVMYLIPNLPRLDYVLVFAGLNDVGMWLYAERQDPNYLDDPSNWSNRIGEAFRVSNFTPDDQPLYKHLEVWKRLSIAKSRFFSRRNRSQAQHSEIIEDAELRWLEQERANRKELTATFVHRAKLDTLPATLASYGRTLARIVREARAQGVEPIFMGQLLLEPTPGGEENPLFWMGAMDGGKQYAKDAEVFRLVGQFNQRMREQAELDGVLYLQPPMELYQEEAYFYDGVHLNEAGARVFASWLADNLAPLVLQKASYRRAELAQQ
jgi:lysophospholipase L1-like esterase